MQEWMNELPAELQSNETLNQYTTMDAALSGLIETKSALGNSIRIPGENAGDEDNAAFISKLMDKVPSLMKRPDNDDPEFWKTFGVPDDHAGYDIPEGVTLPEGSEATFREMMHKANLSKSQANAFLTEMGLRGDLVTEEIAAADQASEQKLRAEWGSAYDARMKMVDKVKAEFFSEGMTPAALYKLGKAMLSGETEFAVQPDGPAGTTPAEANAQIAEIDANPAYWDKSHPQYATLSKKRLELLSLANPAMKTDPASLRSH